MVYTGSPSVGYVQFSAIGAGSTKIVSGKVQEFTTLKNEFSIFSQEKCSRTTLIKLTKLLNERKNTYREQLKIPQSAIFLLLWFKHTDARIFFYFLFFLSQQNDALGTAENFDFIENVYRPNFLHNNNHQWNVCLLVRKKNKKQWAFI